MPQSKSLTGIPVLAYKGVEAPTPPNFIIQDRAPTPADSKIFNIGDLWLHYRAGFPATGSNEDIYMLVQLERGVATWVSFGGGDLETLTGNVGGPVGPDVNDNINTIGDGVGITVVGNPGTNTLTWSLVGGGVAAQSFPTGPGASTVSGGIAVPTAAGVLNVLGDHNVDTGAAVANTVTVFGTNAITLGDLADISLGDAITIDSGDIYFNDPNGSQDNTTIQQLIWNDNTGANTHINFYLNNINIGSNAGNLTATPGQGIFNIAIGTGNVGAGPLDSITTGNRNIGIGDAAGTSITTGSNNTGIGYGTIGAITTGGNNTAYGHETLNSVVTGSNNCAFGLNAGQSITGADSNNIYIGSAVMGTAGDNNTLVIGGGTGAGANQINRCFIAGIRGITTTINDAIAVLVDSGNQLGTVSSSARYKENIKDMGHDSAIIYALRPVVFTYKQHPGIPAWGLIAEEVAQVFPQLVVFKDEQPESIKYHDLPVLLLNELQRLAKRVEQLEKNCCCKDKK